VFKAWTESEHLVRWSCPNGFTLTHAEGDLRPGGAWRACLRSPEGADLWLGGVYREIVEGKRLVFTHAWDGEDGEPGHETLVTVTLADARGKTRMTFRQAFFGSVESRDGHRGGWGECFEKLAAYLPRLTQMGGQPDSKGGKNVMTLTLPSDREIVLTRVFDAPRRLVFEAHATSEHLKHWWGPRRLTISACEMDFRPGGAGESCTRGPRAGCTASGASIGKSFRPSGWSARLNSRARPATCRSRR
jgi:uncharacterized protein YndB with AHSA1/START domain